MEHGTVSRQEIASALGYSMPTVFANVTELMEMGLIREAGEYSSTPEIISKPVNLVT